MKTLNKIFWKGFWKNKRNYGLFVLSASFLISISFFISAFGDFLSNLITEKQGNYLVEYAISYSFTLVYIFMEIFLILSAICYARTRVNEYRVYHLMGITRKQRRVLIGQELLLTASGSIICGLILGFIVTVSVGKVVSILNPQYLEYFDLQSASFLAATSAGIVEFGFMFFILESLVFYLGLDEVLQFGTKSGKKPKKHPILWKISVLMFVVCFLMQNTYWGVYVTMPIAFAIYLMHVSLWGDLFQKKKKNEQKYYRSITWLNSWYHRFYSNINMIFIVSFLIFIAIFMYTPSIGDAIPIKGEEHYKYDIVWMTDSESQGFLDEMKKEYDVDIKKQSCIYLTTPDTYEHVGISQTDYENLTGDFIELKEGEVGINYQKRRDDRNAVGIAFGDTTPDIYMGRSNSELWIVTGRGVRIPSAKFDTSYRLKQTENHVIWGAFGTGDDESIVIFQDEYFKTNLKDDMLVSININEKTEKVRQKIYSYIDSNTENTYRIYDRKILEKQDESNHLLYIVLYGLSFLLIVGCSVMIAAIKLGNDAVEMEHKYTFYRKMGMEEKMWKQGVKRECMMSVLISTISGILVGCIYVMNEMRINDYGKECMLLYGSVILIAFSIIAIICLVLILVATKMTVKKVEGIIS